MPEFGWTTGEEGKTPLLDLKAGASLELSKDKRFVDYLEQQKIANQLNVPTAVVEAQPALAKSKLEQLEIEKNPALQQIAAQGPEYAALVRENKEEIVSVASYFEQEEQATPKRKKIYEVIAEAWERDEKEKENESTLLRAIKAPERFMSGVFNSIIMPELSLRAADYAIETSEKAMDAFNDAPGFLEGYEAAKKSLLLSRNENLEGMKNSLNFAWDEGKIQNRALEISSALLSGDFESADRVADEYRADFAEIEKNKKSGPNSEGLEWLAAPAITNFARDVENAPLMAGATVAGTLVGSGVGFILARGKGAAQGAKLGTFIGYMSGQGAVSFQVEMGSFYADTASELDDRGEALPKDSVRAAAFLYASGATAIEMGADTYLAKALGLGKIADKAGLIVARKEFKEKLVDLAKSQKGQELLTNIAVKMAKGMTSEGLEEASQEALSMLISYELKEQLNVNGDNDFANNELFTRENLSQLENAFSTGARAFLGQGSAITLGSTILDARANAAILKFADKEQALSEAINDGAIKKLSPDHAEVAIEQLGAKGNIHIQATDFIELEQSAVLAEALGLDFEHIEQAAAKGHVLEIPRAKALVRLDKEQYAIIAPIMRHDAEALNAKEVQEIEENLGQVILEKAKLNEAASREKARFEDAVGRYEENVITAIENNPGLKAQAQSLAGGVKQYVKPYINMLTAFSERMAYTGQAPEKTFEKMVVSSITQHLQPKNKKTKDPVKNLQSMMAGLNDVADIFGYTPQDLELAANKAVEHGLLSKEEAEYAKETLSNPEKLEAYHNESFKRELQKEKPAWLKHIWGRLDAKSLKETWPDAYKEIVASKLGGVFARKQKGVAIDELADELKRENLLRPDESSDELVEKLKTPMVELFQPLNANVDLDKAVSIIEAIPQFEGKEIWQLVKGDVPKQLKKLAGTYKNLEQGWDIKLTRQGIEHAISSATSRGLAKEGFASEHIEAVANLPALIEQAVLIESHSDKKGESLKQVHRMYAPMQIGQDVFTVKMTIKEYSGEYLVEIEGLKKLYDLNLAKKVSGDLIEKPGNYFNEQVAPPAPDTLKTSDGYVSAAFSERKKTDSTSGNLSITLRTLLDGVKDHAGNTFFQAVRGSVQIFEDSYFISLFKEANLSTLLHETAHVFMNEIEQAVSAGVADASMQADWKTLQAWLSGFDEHRTLEKYYNTELKAKYQGQGLGKLSKKEYEKVKYIAKQEYFARGFEAYLREGKAPTPALQSAFRRFSHWLKTIYKQVSKLNVELTDEVRQVFDRMLVVDQQIEQAAIASEFVYATEQQLDNLGIKGAQREHIASLVTLAKESAAAKMREERDKNFKRHRQQWAKEAKEKLDWNTAREFINQPGNALDVSILIDELGEEAVKELRKKLGPRAISKFGETGQHPSVVAAEYGFASMQAMIEHFLNSPSKSQIIRQYVEDKQAEHDALYSAESYLLETDEFAERLKAIGEYIEKSLGKESRQNQYLFSVIATNHLANMPMNKAISQRQFLTALKRALKEERAASIKSDYTAALSANQRARLNLELVRQSKEVSQKLEKLERSIKRFVLQKSADPAAQYIVMNLGSRYCKMCNWNEKLAEGRDESDIQNWIANKEAEGYPLFMDDKLLYGQKQSLGEMTVNDFETLHDMINQIIAVERVSRQLDTAKGKADLDTVAKEIAENIFKYREGKTLKTVEEDPALKRLFGAMNASHSKMEQMLINMDGGKFGGPLHSYIYMPLTKAADAQELRFKDLRKKINGLLEDYTSLEGVKKFIGKEFIAEIGESLTFSQRLAVALNMGNEGNISRLMDGHHWTAEQIQAVVYPLTKNDWQFVQGMWDLIGSFKEEAFNMQQQLTGIRPKEVAPKPVQTPYGLFPGGYFPIVYNPKKGGKVKELDIVDNVNRLFGTSGPGAAMTKTGHNKERAKMGLGIPLLLDPKVAADHMFNVVHDITHREAVMDAAKVIRHPKVKHAIESAYGAHIYKELMPWLRDVANEQQGNFDGFQKACGFVRTNLSVAAMGLKAGTAIQQLSGFTKTISHLGYKQTSSGFKKVYSNPLQFKAMLNETFARSTFMATRMNNYNRDIRDATKILDGNVGIRAWPSKIKKVAFAPMCVVQMSIDLPTWWAAFEKGLNTFKGDEIKAAEYADSTVRLTQGSGEVKDLARIQRGTNAHKLLTCFYSDFNLHYNLVAREISSLKRDLTPRTIFNTANTMLLLWVGEALLSAFLSGRGPDEDEDPAEWAADIIIRAPFQGVVGVRDVVNAVRSPFGYEITPAAGVVASGVNWIDNLWKAIEEDEPEKIIKPTVKALSYLGGLPLDGPFIPVENVYDYLSGNDPEFYFRDLLYRKPKSRR